MIIAGLFFTIFAGTGNIQAQSGKKILRIEDVELWRNNSITLSDDGSWYTVIYSLTEKPEQPGKGSKEGKTEKDNAGFYGKDAKTDVLYIFNSEEGLKYQVPDGSNPAFSSSSEWIAYRISPERGKEEKEDSTSIIEVRNLLTGEIRQYKSDADYQFAEDRDYFITSDDNSLLIYDLNNQREHYIGNIGEFMIDKLSEYIAYTISSEDKRGNGIYLYNPADMTTRALRTGNYCYSNLSWNTDGRSLAALKYSRNKNNVDITDMSIIVVSEFDSAKVKVTEYMLKDIEGIPEQMGPAVRITNYPNEITWSNDNKRLFIKIRKYDSQTGNEKVNEDRTSEEEPSVNVWHWKDKKLLSQSMVEEQRKTNVVYDALFILEAKRIIPLTDQETQRMITSKGTDNWAIETDNSKYISDWDIRKTDLYKINLITGDKKLIAEEYAGRVEISPDGEKLILWQDGHYWYHNLKTDSKKNITSGMEISFIDDENDHYGYVPDYGFVGWVKDQSAVIVNHKLDLWLLSIDEREDAVNLTESITRTDSIRFRVDDMSFSRKPDIEDRYIDLSCPIILSAFNLRTKYAGYYKLEDGNLTQLIYMPASFSSSGRRSGLIKAEKNNAIIFRMGNYRNFPEAYLTDSDFSNPRKITNTNPQQEEYKWGSRILFDYTNDDGVPLQGILSIPDDYKKNQKLPMIVYSYEKMSQYMYQYPHPSISGSSICEMMYVSDGYLVLRPDIHFNIGTPHSDMHECIDAAIEKVIELGYVDEARIGYEGFSFGGHCGMYISTQDNRFAAIAAGAGVSNLVQGFNIDIVRDGSNEQDYYITGQGRLGTDPTTDTGMFLRESAVFNAANMNTPLLLFHGTADEVVQWEHSFGFYSILRYLKKPVVFLSYQGEGHGLRKKSNRIDIQNRLKEYFDHFLKDKEAGDWIKQGIPYIQKDINKEKGTERRSVPPWK